MKSKPKTFAAKNKSAPAHKAQPAPRKVIQIAVLPQGSPFLAMALCDDGSVWLLTQVAATRIATDQLVNVAPPSPPSPEPVDAHG
jgi:hypothetical protein